MALTVVAMMLAGFALGVPVVYSILIPSTFYMALHHVPLLIVPQKVANGLESFPLLAVPFFIAAGELMNTGGVTRRLVGLASTLVGHITGGLAHTTVVSNMIMAGMSGSNVADAAGTGRVLVPAMTQAGYGRAFAGAMVGAASTIGPIIPPSIPFVIYGYIASASVGRLFLGGVVPGVLMGIFLLGTAYLISVRRGYPRQPRATFRQCLSALRSAAWALLMPVIIVGGILSGIVTPTEAAGIAALYGLGIGIFVHQEIRIGDLLPIAVRVVRSTAVVLFIVAGASVLQQVFAREKLGETLVSLFSVFSDNRIIALLGINLLFLILGCFLDGNTLLLVFIPLFLPTIDSLGVDRVHFGVFATLNLMIGALTPPVGIVLYVILNICEISMAEFTREIWPMVVALVLVLVIITLVPGTVLFLPNLLMGVAQ